MKKILIAFSAVLMLILIFIMVLPAILSTSWGTKQALLIVNKQIPGKLNVDQLSINWFGPQIIQNAILKDPEGNFVAHFDKLTTDASIFSLILKKGRKQNIELSDFDMIIEEATNGSTNLHEALGLSHAPSPTSNKSRPPLTLQLLNVYSKTNLNSDKQPIQISLNGKTKQSEINGYFNFDILLEQTQIKDNTILNPIQLTADVSHFPIAIIDHFISLSNPELTGAVRTLLGDTLEISLKQKRNIAGFSFELISKTPSSSLISEGKIENGRIQLINRSTATLKMNPTSFSALKALSELNIPFELLNQTTITLVLDKLDFSSKFLTNEANSSEDAPPIIMGNLSISPLSLQGNFLPNPVKIQSLNVNIIAPETSKKLLIQLQAEAEQEGKPLQISLNANFDKPNTLEELLDLVRRQHRSAAQPGEIQFSLNLPSITLPNIPQVGNVKINQLKLNVDGTLFGKMKGELLATILPEDQKILSLLGSALNIDINASLEMHEDQTWMIEPYTAVIKSELLNVFSKGTFSNLQFSLSEPIKISYKLVPQNLAILGLEAKEIKLDSTPLTMKILPFKASLDDLFSVQQNAVIDLQSIKLTFIKGDHALIQNISMPIKYTPNDKQIQIDLKADSIFNAKHKSNISGKLIFSNWLNNLNQIEINNASAVVDLEINNLPSAFISTYTEMAPLEELLGPTLSLQTTGSFSLSTQEGDYSLKINGQDLSAKLFVNKNKDFISNTSPVILSVTLTPTRFAAFQKLIKSESDNKFTLLENSYMNLKIPTLKIPTNFSLKNGQFLADLSISKIHLQHNEQQKLDFENIETSMSSQNLMESFSFQIKAEEQLNGQRYPIIINGNAKDYLTEIGKIDTSALTLNLEVKSPRLPASLLCQLANLDRSTRKKVEALFGETINTDIKINLQKMHGPLFAKLVGKNGKLTLDAQLNEGSMSLKAPFEAEFAVTPELEKSIIQDIIPILSGVINAEQPIKIKIDAAGFFLPLKQIELDKIVLEKGTIELGKMHFSDSGTLGSVFDLLGRTHKDELSVKFTPLYFKMDRGTIKLSRMDMLFMGQYPMAIWGKVNPVKDKVDIRIGITGAALTRALSIPDLEKDYMMQLPLTGSLSNASIDKTKALGRISALIAQSHGSPQGSLLGAVLGIASGELSEEAVPPPTTNPLPWDLTIPKGQSKNNSPKKEKKKDKSVTNEVEKAANSLLENIFK